jgi:chaperonin GroEL
MTSYLKEKKVLYGEESRAAILRGADMLADAVKVTLGPKGRNVIIGRRFFGQDPSVTKDGVTVANVVNPTDPCEQIGADLMRAAAQKTVEAAGDGTTTSVVLAQAMLHAGFDAVSQGASPIAVKRGMDRACESIVAKIKAMAVPVTGDMARQVALVSANGDQEVARVVTEAVQAVGKDGAVTIEESFTLQTHVEVASGLVLQSGLLSPHFITNPETMQCEFRESLILLWEGQLSTAKSLISLINLVAAAGEPLVLVAGEYQNEALAVIAQNLRRARICPIMVGAFGERRREILRDLAALTGGVALTEELGRKIETITADDFGQLSRASISQTKALVCAASPGGEAVLGRIEEVRHQIEKAQGVEKAHLQARLAGLTGGVAIIRVGAATEVEMREKKDRVDDSVHAVQCAMQEGVVEGGGMALYEASDYIEESSPGADVVMIAAQVPLRQILQNAGHEKIPLEIAGGLGYDAATDTFKDLKVAGIIDPAKVVIEALKNAVSVAGMILTSEVMVAEVLEER